MKNQIINGDTKEIIVTLPKFCGNTESFRFFKQFPYPPFRNSFN